MEYRKRDRIRACLEGSAPVLILPVTAETREGHLFLGGCDAVALARKFGTPLYVFDEATIRAQTRAYRDAFARCYPNTLLCYAAKAFLNPWLASLIDQEGFGLDIVSGGELAVAQAAGFPMERVHFHGNNKLPEEVAMALDLGVGRIVIDNFSEIPLLDQLAAQRGVTAAVWLRVAPGIEAHTHEYLQTGGVYSKFGIPIATGQASEAIEWILSARNLQLTGLHAHIGSQIFELQPYRDALRTLLDFAGQVRRRHGVEVAEISPGGGLGIQYLAEDDPPSIVRLAEDLASELATGAGHHGGQPPRLVLEPGRSIVGPAGVTLYTAGSIKRIPGKRTYVTVDGGMGDNIRPALYGAGYTALAAAKMELPSQERVAIAGKYCESGDILIEGVDLPAVDSGDIIAVPSTGAYCIPLASNYNLSLKPAIIAVAEGKAALVRRRETYRDLMSCEVLKHASERR